ncbi:MAG: Na+/H+ antiporter NhaC family protein, partial [Pseudobutyrivibrio sp.]|nr:Na+/H+ antiporter NhaC family protein [Pseudobutyrivibrio sp.]
AGADCDHIRHVSTQLPYAFTVAAVSLVSYIVSGFVRNWAVCLAVGVVLMICTLFVIKRISTRKLN